LLRCIQAVAGCIVLFSVRFGPLRLFHGAGTLSSINECIILDLPTRLRTDFVLHSGAYGRELD
jgi:hypothetical protein